MAFVQGETSFYVLRLLLGATEAGFFPAVLFYLSCWFPSSARPRVFSYFLAAVPLGGIIGFPLSGLLLGLDGVWGFKGWQWLFLLEALPSLIVGVIAYFYLTDRPSEAGWLSAEERDWLDASLQADIARTTATPTGPARIGASADGGQMGSWTALVTARNLAFAGIHFCGNLAIYGLGFFLPQIVKSLGATNMTASLVSALPYVVGAIGLLREATGTFVAGLYGSAAVMAVAAVLVLLSTRRTPGPALQPIAEPAE